MRRYAFGKYLLDIPDDHKIVSIHRDAAFYDRAYGFILEEISKVSPAGVFLDIGGNIGDSAAFFASHVPNPILSVEGDSEFAAYFKSNLRYLGKQVRFIERFVRTEALKDLQFAFNHDAGSGYLSVTDSASIDAAKFITTDELLKQAGPLALVKSDTDGMDGFIIADIMDKVPDVPLFFECDTMYYMPGTANPWPHIFRKLDEYSVVLFDNQGLPMVVAETNAAAILRDLSGYLHLQRCVHPVRTHYLDVWAFPSNWQDTFDTVANRLRSDLLKPYAF